MNMTSKPNLREKFKETTREAIIDAAISLIISQSSEVRMEDIADKAGVAIGTLYNYFANRQMLIDTIIEKRRAMAENSIRQSLSKTEGLHISARLENLFQTLISFLERHRTVTHHSLQAKEINENNPGQKSLMNMLNDYVSEILETALERKEIRADYMDVYPLVISSYLRSIFTKLGEGQDELFRRDLARKMAELFLIGASE